MADVPFNTWLLTFIAVASVIGPAVGLALQWAMRSWLKELAVNTNSIQEALNAANIKAGIGEGVAKERARQADAGERRTSSAPMPESAKEGLETASKGLKDAAAAVHKATKPK